MAAARTSWDSGPEVTDPLVKGGPCPSNAWGQDGERRASRSY